MLRTILLISCLLFTYSTLYSQTIGYFQPEGISYNPDIPTPSTFLGHELGEQPVRHDMMVLYLRELASLSDRITIETIGYSYEGRPIEFLVITSPDNHTRMDEIREKHLANTIAGSEAKITEEMPVFTWLNFGVHGAEAAAMDAALPVVYHLAAGDGNNLNRALNESVILITAVLNPDGHAKRITQKLGYKSNVPVADPAHAGHDLWATQRSSHYWFDLNRQWLLVNQKEPQIWVRNWHKWKPNVSADFHEMGTTSARPATYHFSPPVPDSKNPLVPAQAHELTQRAADFHSQAHDRNSTLYFVEESFPGYYIGTGSTYPQLHGSIGILFEAGTAGAGKLETDLGYRTYSENIRLHFTSALSTIEAARSMRQDLLAYQKSFFNEAVDQGAADNRGAFVFTSYDRSRLAHFVELIQIHDIEVFKLSENLESDGHRFLVENSYIVPLEQENYRMIRGIFERVREFDRKIFYDVSGWTLPLSYGIETSAIGQRSFSENLLGSEASPQFPTAPTPDRSSYGYVFSWDDYYAPKTLYRLMDQGIKARASLKPFTLKSTRGEINFDRGSIFIPLEGQKLSDGRILEILSDISQTQGTSFHAAVSGRTATEGVDLGAGRSFQTLNKPNVLLLFDDGIQTFDAGHIWHLLDYRMEISVAMKQKNRVMEIDWKKYTHLVIPGGNDVGLDEKATERVKQWVREDGGTVIGMRQAALWAQETLLGRPSEMELTSIGEPGGRYNYEQRETIEAEHAIGGVIVSSDLDITHPLGFGYKTRSLASYRDTPVLLTPPDNPFATIVQYVEDNLVLSGYLSEKRADQIAGTPMMIAERLGSGSVVLIADNPNFRGAWLGTNRLFLNSLFFSNTFNSPRSPDRSSFRP